jgi:trimeric autotransporter adhesin
MANPIIKVKRGTGSPVSLQLAELGFDKLNKKLFIGTEEGVFDLSGESYAKKTFVNDAVAAEAALRESGDSTLTSNLNAEISRAQGAEGVNAAAITAEETARIAAVSAEQSARSAADSVLDGKITTEKGRIDAILSAADADKDSFAEIVTLINSVDTENDTAFAGYVTSNNAALAQEVSDRTAADTALGVRIDSAEGVSSALDTRVTAAESDIVDNAAAISAEETARIAAVSAEASARSSADTTLQGNIDSEASTRAAADTSLSNRLDSLEAVSSDSRLTDLEADVADHETRITALETTIDGGTY